jgi:hypothetical protein
MTEILFTFFFLLSFFLLMRESGWRKKQSKFLLLIAGICLGLASLTRAVVGFPLLICTLFVVLILSHGLLREKIIGSFTLAFGWISVISIWCVRNYLLTGYIFLQAFSGNHCINHGAVPVVMRSQGCSYAQARDSVYADLCHDHFIATQKKQDCLDQVEKCFVAQATAAKIMLCHPYALMHHSIINMIKTLCGLYSSELLVIDSGGQLPEYDNNRGYKEMICRFIFPTVHNRALIPLIYGEIVMHFFVLLGASLFCLCCLWNMTWRRIAFLIGPFIGVFIGLSCLCGFARLRLPIECFLIMVAVAFWHYLFFKKR